MKLTKAQRTALALVPKKRPVAGNDDGWVSMHDVRYPTLRRLVELRLLQDNGPEGPRARGYSLYRLTPAGLAALREGRDAV